MGTNMVALAALLVPAQPMPGIGWDTEKVLPRYRDATAKAGSWFGFDLTTSGTAALSATTPFTAAPTSQAANPDRATTAQEEVVGELRKWGLLERNWDGEGAGAPIRSSLSDAALLVHLLPADVPVPEPMLHATGRAGLYWNDGGLYADLEFLGDGRMTYYVERHGKDKHKGVVEIRKKEMSAVLEALLRA
jgi:hypothetical protein